MAWPTRTTQGLRPNERLRSVIKESTAGAAIQTLEQNTRFRLVSDVDGNPRWLALLLKADSIGGLSEKSRGDETKGALVQQILADHIQVIATDLMLDQEFFAIVPSETSLESMGEYQLLRQAPYHWVIFSQVNGELTFDQNIGEATYEQALTVQSGTPLQTVIVSADPSIWARIEAGAGVAGHIGDRGPAISAISAPTPQSPTTPVRAPQPSATPEWGSDGDVDDIFGGAAVAAARHAVPDYSATVVPTPAPGNAVDEGISYGDLEAGESYGEPVDYDPLSDDGFTDTAEDDIFGASDQGAVPTNGYQPAGVGTEEAEVMDAAQASYVQYLEVNQGREFTQAEIRESIARRFLADDLDFTVDMAEFELAFQDSPAPTVTASTVVPAEGTDWLGGQVAQLAQAANSELALLHAKHRDELRQLYVDYSSQSLQDVIHEVRLTDPVAPFGKAMQTTDVDRQESLDNAHVETTARRREIERRFDEDGERAAAAAAAQARSAHDNVTRARREQLLTQVDREVAQGIEAVYETARQRVLVQRRAEADLAVQKGKTAILQALAAARSDQLTAEQAILSKWNERMLDVVDQNRKVDVARAEALAENLARNNAVEVERQHTATRIEQIRADHLAREQELEQRVTRIREDASAEQARRDAEWQRTVELANQKTTGANDLATNLQGQLANLTSIFERQYQSRIETLETVGTSYKAELERSARSSQRMNRTLITFMVLLTVVALAIGLIFGWTLAH